MSGGKAIQHLIPGNITVGNGVVVIYLLYNSSRSLWQCVETRSWDSSTIPSENESPWWYADINYWWHTTRVTIWSPRLQNSFIIIIWQRCRWVIKYSISSAMLVLSIRPIHQRSSYHRFPGFMCQSMHEWVNLGLSQMEREQSFGNRRKRPIHTDYVHTRCI